MQNTVVKSPSATTKPPAWKTHLISRKDFIETSEKLIRGIKTPEDMTLARIKSITGLKFEPISDDTEFIYRMHFDDGNKAAFMLDVEHMNEKYGIIRPRFSLSIDKGGEGSFFDTIKLFHPMVANELGYREAPNEWNLQMDWYQYELGKGNSRILLTMPYSAKSISIKAEEYIPLGGSHW